MKLIKHWGFCLSLSITSLFLLLFFVLYFNWISLPNSGYSKGVEIQSFAIGSNFEDYNKSKIQVISHLNGFYTFSLEENYLFIHQYDSNGLLIDSKKFMADLLHTHYTFYFDNDHLNAKAFNTKTHTIDSIDLSQVEEALIYKPLLDIGAVQEISLLSQAGLFYKEGVLYLTDFKTIKPITSSQYFENMLFKQDGKGSYDILMTEFIDKGYSLKHYKLSVSDFIKNQPDALFVPTNQFDLGAGSIYVPTEMDFMDWRDQYHYGVVIKDTKTGVNQLLWMAQDLQTKEVKTVKKIEPGYLLYPTFYINQQQLLLAYNKGTSVGKVEIGSTHSVFENIVSTQFDDFTNCTEITKSIKPSIFPTFFELNHNKFVVYSRTYDGKAHIFLSSTHPDWIKRGKTLMASEWVNLILTTATTFLPLSYMALILEVYILTPVLAVIVLISMVKITWAERNGKKLLIASILLHTLAKAYFIFSKVISQPDVIHNFPQFLNSPIKIVVFGTLYTFVSLYCLLSYSKKHPDKHYFNYYIFFNLIDMLQFIMLFTPYYLI